MIKIPKILFGLLLLNLCACSTRMTGTTLTLTEDTGRFASSLMTPLGQTVVSTVAGTDNSQALPALGINNDLKTVQDATIGTVYQSGFGRFPVAAEYTVWETNLAAGNTYSDIYAAIRNTLKTASKTDQDALILSAYQNGFGRSPVAAEYSVWETNLATGNIDYADIIAAIRNTLKSAASQEKDLTITAAYQDGAGRLPVASEFSVWENNLASGNVDYLTILEAIHRSAYPFQAQGKTGYYGFPFSFYYQGTGGQNSTPSADSSSFIANLIPAIQKTQVDANTVLVTHVFLEPTSGLQIRFYETIYADQPAVEWMVAFDNVGNTTTGVLTEVNAADFSVSASSASPVKIHYNLGALESTDPRNQNGTDVDFSPKVHLLSSGQSMASSPSLGKSSSSIMPFFNVENPGGGGVLLGIGWSGQWASNWTNDGNGQLNFTAGQQTFNAQLLPKESVRTPSILAMDYTGTNYQYGQNLWRRLMTSHYLPTRSGKALTNIATTQVFFPGDGLDTSNQAQLLAGVAGMKKSGLQLDASWVDAGWYPTGGFEQNWYTGAGDWTPDPSRFPDMPSMATTLKNAGMDFMLWMESERTTDFAQSFLATVSQKPSYFLYPPQSSPDFDARGTTSASRDYSHHQVNLGNDNARVWLTGRINQVINTNGVTIYRQDMNIKSPLAIWSANDSADRSAPLRSGMTEAKYIAGLYHFWDDLRSANPNLLIDNCASGGRRVDIEMMKRSVIFWRSDSQMQGIATAGGRLSDVINDQAHEIGLAAWAPYEGGTTSLGVDPVASVYQYRLRSNFGMTEYFGAPWDLFANADGLWSVLFNEVANWRAFGTLFGKDFYSLSDFEKIDSAAVAGPVNLAAIEAAYRDGFGRSPTANEIEVWSGQMNLYGRKYGDVLAAVSASLHGQNSDAWTQTIYAAYQEGFGRDPLPAEVSVWLQNIQGGAIYKTMIDAMKASLREQSADTQSAMINQAYSTGFGRLPNASELSVWQTNMSNGQADYSDMLNAITTAQTKESQLTEIFAAYRDSMGRMPNYSEIAVWAGQILRSGSDYNSILLAASQAFHQSTANQLIPSIYGAYQEVLGRDPIASELSTWQSKIQNGALYRDIVSNLKSTLHSTSSQAAQALQATNINQAYSIGLGRSPTADESSYWTMRMNSSDGATYSEIADAITLSLIHSAGVALPILNNQTWAAWQFHDPGNANGIAQIFRREQSYCPISTEKMAFHMQGLDSQTTYVMTDVDTNKQTSHTGSELMSTGLRINCAPGIGTFGPAAMIVKYRANN